MGQENAHLLKQLEGGVVESAEVSHFVFFLLLLLLFEVGRFHRRRGASDNIQRLFFRSRFVPVQC